MAESREQYWTRKRAARELDCHVETVTRWLEAGLIPGYRVGERGHWRVSRAGVERVKQGLRGRGSS